MNVVIVTGPGGNTMYYGPFIPNDAQKFASSQLLLGCTVSIQILFPLEVQ